MTRAELTNPKLEKTVAFRDARVHVVRRNIFGTGMRTGLIPMI